MVSFQLSIESSVFTNRVGKIDPRAFPTLLAMEAQVVARALEESENQVRARRELELRKNGYPRPAKVFPSMKNHTFTLISVLNHIPMPVSTIPMMIYKVRKYLLQS